VIRDHLKAVLLGHMEGFQHRVVNHVSDFAAIFRGLSLTQVNPNEWHYRIIPSDVRGHQPASQVLTASCVEQVASSVALETSAEPHLTEGGDEHGGCEEARELSRLKRVVFRSHM
jgi:hypothetical protein